MTSTLTFYDAAYPPAVPPVTDGVCIYIGGNTPHVWTDAEVARQKARYRLPVFVRSNPGEASVASDISAALNRLAQLKAPHGTLVAWDLETAVDPGYIRDIYTHLTQVGYQLIVYGSQSTVLGNQNPDGLYWGADWTGKEHLAGRNSITQYVSFAAYDESVALSSLPFWDIHGGSPAPTPPPVSSVIPDWQEKIMNSLPTVATGASGAVVRTVQGLCCARGFATVIDGSFGPQTETAVRNVQAHSGSSVDGVVGPQTWAVLVTGKQ